MFYSLASETKLPARASSFSQRDLYNRAAVSASRIVNHLSSNSPRFESRNPSRRLRDAYSQQRQHFNIAATSFESTPRYTVKKLDQVYLLFTWYRQSALSNHRQETWSLVIRLHTCTYTYTLIPMAESHLMEFPMTFLGRLATQDTICTSAIQLRFIIDEQIKRKNFNFFSYTEVSIRRSPIEVNSGMNNSSG